MIDPEMAGDLLYPVASGPSLERVAAAIGRVLDTGQVVAVGLACNWKAQAQPRRKCVASSSGSAYPSTERSERSPRGGEAHRARSRG